MYRFYEGYELFCTRHHAPCRCDRNPCMGMHHAVVTGTHAWACPNTIVKYYMLSLT